MSPAPTLEPKRGSADVPPSPVVEEERVDAERTETRGTAAFVRMASRPIPRVGRMMRVARECGLEPLFLGAFRSEGLADEDRWEGVRVRRVGRPFPLLNGRRPLTYLMGVLRFNLALLRTLRHLRPVLVHASDVETLPATVLHRLIYRVPLVYNVHDNLADRYVLPRLGRWALNQLEGLGVLACDAAVVPEAFRRDALPAWCRSRIEVVRNAPVDTGAEPPRSIGTLRPGGEDRVRLFYAGWLDWGRGLRGLLRLAEQHPWIEVSIAGEGEPSILEEVRAAPVEYLGFLDHDQILRRTREADFVAAFYDPVRPINRAAAPNKLAEAFSVGRPVIVNEEVLVAAAPSMADATLRVPYARIEDCAAELRALAGSPERYAAACRAARRRYEEDYAWEGVRDVILAVYGAVGVRSPGA